MGSQPRQLAHTTVAAGVTTTLLAAANPNRTYLLLQTDGATDVYLGIGVPAVVGDGIRLNNGGGSLEISAENGNLDTRAINGISTVASDVLVSEA